MTTLAVHVETAAAAWKNAFPSFRKKIEAAAACAARHAAKPAALKGRSLTLDITLATDARVRRLNRDYRGRDKATNVLSFPQQAEGAPAALPKTVPLPLGDVILARGVIGRECRAEGKRLEDHTIHLVVHGVLHLFGYDHMRPKDAKIMEKLECDILKRLGYPDPYHATARQNRAGRANA